MEVEGIGSSVATRVTVCDDTYPMPTSPPSGPPYVLTRAASLALVVGAPEGIEASVGGARGTELECEACEVGVHGANNERALSKQVSTPKVGRGRHSEAQIASVQHGMHT